VAGLLERAFVKCQSHIAWCKGYGGWEGASWTSSLMKKYRASMCFRTAERTGVSW